MEAAWGREPLVRLKNYLISNDAWSEEQEQALEKDVAEKVEAAVEEYLATGNPGIASMFDYMFEELPHDLQAQKEKALEELTEGGADHG